MAYSFFDLTPPQPLTADDALPGISASEADFLALIEAIHTTLDTFCETHPDLTYGDAIHAVLCVKRELIASYADESTDA